MLTQERLQEVLNYDPLTGVFVRINNCKGHYAGIAGSISHLGYIQVWVDRKPYLGHRLAWLYMTGNFPDGHIDHINGVRGCNIWTNLRECTNQQNQLNVGISASNTSGFRGVSFHKPLGKWKASGKLNGKNKHLGYYTEIEQASEAYQAFARQHHGEFYRPTK